MRLVVTMPGTLRRASCIFRSVPHAAEFIRGTARLWGVSPFAVDYRVEGRARG